MFNCTNTVIDITNKEIHVDFERALINSLQEFSSSINLCYFHFARNLQDRVRDLQRMYKTKISKRLYEYGKVLMFVPKCLVKHHRKYMKHLAGRSKNNKRFLQYLDNNYIERNTTQFCIKSTQNRSLIT